MICIVCLSLKHNLQVQSLNYLDSLSKVFYNWMSVSASGYIELIEVDPGVLA
jgi:hypothetical protein